VPKRRFSADQRAEILAQVVGKPTGVIFEFGGMEFDLVALSMSQISGVLDTLQKFPTVSKAMRGGGTDDGIATIGGEISKLLDLAHDLLKRSAFYGETPTDDDVAVFEEWFAACSPMELLKGLGTKVVAAAGLSKTQKDPTPAPTAPSESEPSTSTRPMQPV
jgi:hypothetical protein